MLARSTVLASLFTLALNLTSPAVAAEPASNDVAAQAATLFDAMAANYPALNVTVRRRGQVVWEREAGGVHVIGHSGGSPGGRSCLEVGLEPQIAVALTGDFEGPGLGRLAADIAVLFARQD